MSGLAFIEHRRGWNIPPLLAVPRAGVIRIRPEEWLFMLQEQEMQEKQPEIQRRQLKIHETQIENLELYNYFSMLDAENAEFGEFSRQWMKLMQPGRPSWLVADVFTFVSGNLARADCFLPEPDKIFELLQDNFDLWEDNIIAGIGYLRFDQLTQILHGCALLGFPPSAKFMKEYEKQLLMKRDDKSLGMLDCTLWSCAVLDVAGCEWDMRGLARNIYDMLPENTLQYSGSKQANIWFGFPALCGIKKQFNYVSAGEILLRYDLGSAGAQVAEGKFIKDLRRSLDIALDGDIEVESDGPGHFLFGGRGGKYIYNGSTILRDALNAKFFPESTIVSVPFFLLDKLKGHERTERAIFWYEVLATLRNMDRGSYHLEVNGDNCEIVETYIPPMHAKSSIAAPVLQIA